MPYIYTNTQCSMLSRTLYAYQINNSNNVNNDNDGNDDEADDARRRQ